MKRFCQLLAVLLPLNATATDYYASKTGSGANPGTLASPWTLQAGITTNILTAGDTVWIRGGTYNFTTDFPLMGLNPTVAGSAFGQITFRSYPGERVVINGYFGIYKAYITVRDLEFTDLSTNWGRPTSTGRYLGDGADPFEPALGVSYPRSGVWVEADFCKVINCLVYDCPLGAFSTGASEWHGNVFIGNCTSFTNLDSIGEGLYVHNGDTGLSGDGVTPFNGSAPAVFDNNVFCYGCRAGLNEWGSQLGVVKNVHNTNNVVLYYDFNCRAQVTTVQDNDIINNIVAAAPPNFYTHLANLTIGYGTGICSNIVSKGNLVIGGALGYRNVVSSSAQNNIVCIPGTSGGGFGSVFWDVSDTNTTVMSGNHYYFNSSVFTNRFISDGVGLDFRTWTNTTAMDATSADTITSGVPSTNIVKIVQNRYDPNRITLFIGNFTGASTVSVDLSSYGVSGKRYILHYVPDYFGTVTTGVYSAPLSVNMNSLSIAQPKYVTANRAAGMSVLDFEQSAPTWAAFLFISDPVPTARVKTAHVGGIKGK